MGVPPILHVEGSNLRLFGVGATLHHFLILHLNLPYVRLNLSIILGLGLVSLAKIGKFGGFLGGSFRINAFFEFSLPRVTNGGI